MSCQVQINSILGTPPFYFFLCDINLTQCIYNSSASTPTYPIILDLPTSLIGTNQLVVKIIDGNSCEVYQDYILPSPTPTPSLTMTPTPTPSIYSTPTPTPTPSST